jgi:beta-galactosidase
MPEEYASLGHELFYNIIKDERSIFGTWIWNMFDFANIGRKEGDYLHQGLSLNNKGLVTFDRQIKKDAFYFYKAQWNPEPTLHLTSKRYTDRSYPVTDVKIYTNAQKNNLKLTNNGLPVGQPASCSSGVCIWKNVDLSPGTNHIEVVALFGSKTLKDEADWNLNDYSGSYRIWVGSGSPMMGRYGQRFGSDAFLSEESYSTSLGVGNKLSLTDLEALQIASNIPAFKPASKKAYNYTEPNPFEPLLFKSYRSGTFSYHIPIKNGRYNVKLGFFEPDEKAEIGTRVFNIGVQSQNVASHFDVFQEAGNQAKKAVIKEYSADVTDRKLVLDFVPTRGKAILTFIEITPVL